jgi:uncharacterized protein YdhG (YjbR/CyaY superfamily)
MKKLTGPARDMDDYLAGVPAKARASLEKLRRMIKAAAPEATEYISYQIPAFRDKYMLVGFAAFPKHCSFFVMSTKVMRAHAADLKGLDTSAGTIRFPHDQPLPARLVKKLVKARLTENAERRNRKTRMPKKNRRPTRNVSR